MILKRKPKECQLTRFYFNGIQCLKYATHWVCPLSGDKVKLQPGMKIYYEHRLNRYRYFSEKGCSYNESHPTCAKMLGLSVDTIVKVYNPLLHRMGLIHTNGEWKENNCHYTINELTEMDGWLINEKLQTITSLASQGKKYDKDSEFDYESLKKLNHNKEKSRHLRTRNDEYMDIISRDEKRRLLKIEQDYNNLINNRGE